MKKTVGRGILFYLLILVGVIGGVGCVLAAIMIFSPGTEILGLCYYVNNGNYEIKEVGGDTVNNLIAGNHVSAINITTSYTDVKVVTSHDFSRAQFIVQSHITGLMKAENKVKNVVLYSYNAETHEINIETKFPEMFLPFSTTSEVIIVLPLNAHIGFNLNIVTDNGDTFLGNGEEDDYTLRNVNIVSNKGSDIVFGERARVNGNITINSPSGTMLFNSKLYATELNITSKSAKIQSKDLEVPNVNLRTESSAIKLGEVNGNMAYNARKGVLQVSKITGSFDCGETVIISNITIGTVYGQVLLPSAESSNISITNLYGIATIRTTTGNVTIKNAYSLADITTESGNIYFVADTKSELITADYVEAKGVVCLKTKSGKITAKFVNILLNNNIETESGTIECEFIKTLDFKLKFECGKYAPKVSSGISSSQPEKSGEIVVGDSLTLNTLNIKNNSGRTNISDTLKIEEDD